LGLALEAAKLVHLVEKYICTEPILVVWDNGRKKRAFVIASKRAVGGVGRSGQT
jgi:hypothetical protein